MAHELEAMPSTNLSSYYAKALNKIAHAIATQEDTWHLLQETCQSTGDVLQVDRVVVYDLSFETDRMDGLHEWLNPNKQPIDETLGDYPLDIFREGAEALWRNKSYLISHIDDIYPALTKDGSDEIVHEQMNIKSLLWYPFAFRDDGFYLLILNQVFYVREWQQEEINFLDSVSTLVTIALNKIRLMEEREALLTSVQNQNKELSRLNEAMAHHFQEPVRRLATFSQQLQLNPLLQQDACSKLAVDFIHDQALRLSDLVKAAQRYLGVDQKKFDLASMTNSGNALQAALVKTQFKNKANIEVHSPLPWVMMEYSVLIEVFILLLNNAIQYQKPSVELKVELSVEISADTATFYLADNGSGIAPQYRESVFDLFTRLVSNDQPGAGIGLSLVRKLLQHHKGSIHIESGLQGGSCFVFTLPLAKQLTPQLAKQPESMLP